MNATVIKKRVSHSLYFLILTLLLILIFIVDLLLGSVIIPVKQIFLALFGFSESNETFQIGRAHV